MPKESQVAPPSATGNAGESFEARVGAYYTLSMLVGGEPRGMTGSRIEAVALQQRVAGHPLDDVVVHAKNADGSTATLEIQVKRTLTFTASDDEFADVVGQIWRAAQRSEFAAERYELAVAIARTTTRIEQAVQEVLHWARQLLDASTFAANLRRKGFASDPMRSFVKVFTDNLERHGAPNDDATIWSLLRRFQVLVFDFEAPGSDYEHRARERCRFALASDQADRAGDLWSVLVTDAEASARAAGARNRDTLTTKLSTEERFRFELTANLETAMLQLADSARLSLDEIGDHVGGVRLARTGLIEQAKEALEQHRVLSIVGAPGAGKSAVMKHLAELLLPEGRIIVLRNGRIIPGGWLHMAHVLGCMATSDQFFNEIAAGGGATLFVDNIDQIDDAKEQRTVADLLVALVKYPGWRAVVTASGELSEWRALLPLSLRQDVPRLIVPEISDEEAEQLSEQNPALGVLLDKEHPAKSIARNLFFLSRMVAMAAGSQLEISTEIDLARLWWDYGAGRGNVGRLARLKVLRAMGADIFADPARVVSKADSLDSAVVEELLRLDAIREEVRGALVALRHDVLRDWTLGFMIQQDADRKSLRDLVKNGPLPATLARGLEMAARLALVSDPTGTAWLNLLCMVEGGEVHGSWRRPLLLALPRSESFLEYLQPLRETLLASDGRLLVEIIRLMIVVESEPAAQVLARVQPSVTVPPGAANFVFPKGRGWFPMIAWLVLNARSLPNAIMPDVIKAFVVWLLATHMLPFSVNADIVGILFEWLVLIDEASRPRMLRMEEHPPSLGVPHFTDTHELARMAAFSFALLSPGAARKYVSELVPDDLRSREFETIVKGRGALARAAPAEFVDFFLKGMIEQEDPEDRSWSRPDRGPFGVEDYLFSPASPSQGPFLEILEQAPQEGLRLVRRVVEHATEWRRGHYIDAGQSFPRITIPFPQGAKSFEGDDHIYGWSRSSGPSVIVTSALMALEAWAHSQIEAGKAPGEVLHDVLGPDGSSCAFLPVAIDLILSHWPVLAELAWPLTATPEVLKLDSNRHLRDITGVDRLMAFEQESASAKVKRGDLDARPSRKSRLLEGFPYYVFEAKPELVEALRQSLEQATNEICQRPSEEEDPIHGLRAIAKRARRMIESENWQLVTYQHQDGSTSELIRYVPDTAEERLIALKTAEIAVETRHANVRAGIQLALFDSKRSSSEIVADGLAWARQQAVEATSRSDDKDDFEREWDQRAVVMAAALAVRDYQGDDRAAILGWANEVFERAVNEPSYDRYASNQIGYDKAAIATLGVMAAYREKPAILLRDMLLQLAARPELAVVNALGSTFVDLKAVDDRLLRSIIRIILATASQPRHSRTELEEQSAERAHAQAITQAQAAEQAWLSGQGEEPAWPKLPPWFTRPRRRIARRCAGVPACATNATRFLH